jgi:nucleoside-diphosphate-sugar epimerase
MRIAVTGAAGFLGRAFVRHATAAGHPVAALLRPTSRTLPTHPAVTVAVGTLADPPWDDLAHFAADVCVHAAWTTDAGVYLRSPENHRYLEESLAFVAGMTARGVEHVVALGTCAEYQPSPRPLQEARSPLGPGSPYAHAKHELRLALGERLRADGVGLAWARVFQPYGTGEPPARLCSMVARRLADGQRVELDTPHAVRDWIHVDDVAAALLTLVERRVDAIVNVGTGVGRTVEHIALAIADLLDRRDLVATGSAPGDELDVRVADAGRLRELGWKPRVDLGAGLAMLVEGLT